MTYRYLGDDRRYLENNQEAHESFRRLVAALVANGAALRMSTFDIFNTAHNLLDEQERYIQAHTWMPKDGDEGGGQ